MKIFILINKSIFSPEIMIKIKKYNGTFKIEKKMNMQPIKPVAVITRTTKDSIYNSLRPIPINFDILFF